MARPPRLLVLDPAGARREVPVTQFPFRIGRQTGNELVLRDSRISRQQAQIAFADESYLLEDLGSRHGTFVNGKKISGLHPLAPKDAIDFGMPDSFKLVYLGDEATLEELIEQVEKPAPATPGTQGLYHLGVLLEVARTMGSGLSLEDVLAAVVEAAIRVTRTERGVLLLANEAGELAPVVARDSKGEQIAADQLKISSGVLKRVAASRRELIVSDTGDEVSLGQQASVASLSLLTIVAIPIEKLPVIAAVDLTITSEEAELLGVLYLDSRSPSTAFSEIDREVLRTLAREAATVIENARLFSAARAKARLDHEIEIASQIQRELLPKSFPEMSHVSVTGSTLACHSVGGDCFDVVALEGGRYGFFVGDVAGKGIAASLLATLLQGVFYTTAALDIPLAELTKRVNQFLCERSSEDRYATLFYGVLDPSGSLEYINAGHVPPLVRRASGEVVELGAANFPVGMFPEAEFASERALLQAGDYLVIYSDGVSEARNLRDEMFEQERLNELVKTFPGENVEQLAEAIRTGVRSFTGGAPQADDVTMVVVQYKG
ncbi:MAG TPA: SpoIIE family protein phosphatase [Candidatus Acidoferrales bacterium]|nr:SpoIIE family protein phosphatase [Candidatus Acidoferrales bacterium]